MKNKIFFSFVQIILWLLLLAGLFLLWVFFQSFETLASLLNTLAADGEFESFTVSLFQILKTPLAFIGVVLVSLAGFMIIRRNKIEGWVEKLHDILKLFFKSFGTDTRSFFDDAGVELRGQGLVVNVSLLMLILVALILRLASLDLPLTHDEAYTYNAFASRSVGHLLSDYHLPNNHVFFSLIMHFTTRLFGNSERLLRLPTIIFGILMVPIAYFSAKRFYSKETAVLSAIFVAAFPVLVRYSVLARGYIVLATITLVLFILTDYVRVKKNRFAWLMVALFSAIGFFTIPIMLFSFGALYIWLLVSMVLNDTGTYKTKMEFLKFWVVSGIVAAALTVLMYSPIIVSNYGRFFGNGFIAPLDWDLFGGTTWIRVRNTWIDWTGPIWTGLTSLGALGLGVSILFHKKLSKRKFPLQLAFFIWIVLVMFIRRPDMEPRFWLFIAAPVLIWSAAGIMEPLKRISLKLPKGLGFSQLVVGMAFAFIVRQSLLILPSLPAQLVQKDTLENTAVFLEDYLQDGDLVTTSITWLPQLRYYFNYHEIPRGYIRQSGEFQRAFIIVNNIENNETLHSVSPKLGFDTPAVDMDSAKILLQFEDFTVYECLPVQ